MNVSGLSSTTSGEVTRAEDARELLAKGASLERARPARSTTMKPTLWRVWAYLGPGLPRPTTSSTAWLALLLGGRPWQGQPWQPRQQEPPRRAGVPLPRRPSSARSCTNTTARSAGSCDLARLELDVLDADALEHVEVLDVDHDLGGHLVGRHADGQRAEVDAQLTALDHALGAAGGAQRHVVDARGCRATRGRSPRGGSARVTGWTSRSLTVAYCFLPPMSSSMQLVAAVRGGQGLGQRHGVHRDYLRLAARPVQHRRDLVPSCGADVPAPFRALCGPQPEASAFPCFLLSSFDIGSATRRLPFTRTASSPSRRCECA